MKLPMSNPRRKRRRPAPIGPLPHHQAERVFQYLERQFNHSFRANHCPMLVAYHRELGQALMYLIDAKDAVHRHPDEWSLEPWSAWGTP